jgi:predicted nuclease of predicted toxin-antitoxin system
MRFKLDENLSPLLAALFTAAGHEAHSVIEEGLGGKPDERVIDVCRRESRALVTLDLDFANIKAYPPAEFTGIIVLRLGSQAHATTELAVQRLLVFLSQEQPKGALWIVEDDRIRIHE